MIALLIEAPYASFRKSYARSLAESYPLPPPATVYGMLLSLVGEHFRARHAGVQLAFAYKKMPKVATTLRKLSRYKYGVASKQSKLGNAPDYIETLCGIEFLCWVNSEREPHSPSLEKRIVEALNHPETINRCGVLALGLSDDAVNSISLVDTFAGEWHWLNPCDTGQMELPIWVDHVGSFYTRWQRFDFDYRASPIGSEISPCKFVPILDPR